MPIIDIVATDQDQQYLNDVGLEVFRRWVDFARGRTSLGGQMIKNPTGRYAASISMRRYGTREGVRRPGEIPTRTVSHIAIIADEKLAPEAGILETGHRQVDMLQYLQPGKSYPIGRVGQAPTAISGLEFSSSSYGRSRIRKMWTLARQSGGKGFARTPSGAVRGASNTSHTGRAWVIPPMPIYSPSQILVDLIRNTYGLDASVR